MPSQSSSSRMTPLPLPPPPLSFSRKKETILAQLAVPEGEYSDASPKGSVDVAIRELIDDINVLDGLVTTSSCAGRVCIFVEGRKSAKKPDRGGDEGEGGDAAATMTIAAIGGKGGGGTWLFVSHDPVPEGDVEEGDIKSLLGLRDGAVGDGEHHEVNVSRGDDTMANEDGRKQTPSKDVRLVHFKFEPMILHILTASPSHAQLLLRAGLQAGFRESGAINLTGGSAVTPMVAIRSMGLSFESLVGIRSEDSRTHVTVSDDYLRTLLRIANERFEENAKRIARFRNAVLEAAYPSPARNKMVGKDGEWEDAGARRERKRAEGLRRKAEIQGQGLSDGGGGGGDGSEGTGEVDEVGLNVLS